MGVESRGLDDESLGLDEEGHSVEIDGFILGEKEKVVPEALEGDHAYSAFEVGQGSGFALEPEISERVSASRQPTLTTWTNPEDGVVYIDVPAYPPPAPPVQTPPSPEWSSGSFPIFSAPFIVPSPTSSPMISLTVPSLVATPATAETERFLTELGAQGRTAVTFGALWRPMLALEAWAGRVDTQMTDMSRAGYDDHRLVHDMLLQQTALQRELQEMRGRVTALEQERDRRERGDNRKAIDREWSRGILKRVVVIKLTT
nr:hypothetical protein [Tanacetum cinerariifolium]